VHNAPEIATSQPAYGLNMEIWQCRRRQTKARKKSSGNLQKIREILAAV